MLKDNLTKKLSEQGIGLTSKILASKAGITQATFSRIMTGKIKNPGVYTIAKIAKELNCSIDELVGRSVTCKKNSKNIEKIELRSKLAISCGSAVLDLLDKTKKEMSFETWLDIVTAIYKYYIDKNSDAVDTQFVSWFIETRSKNI